MSEDVVKFRYVGHVASGLRHIGGEGSEASCSACPWRRAFPEDDAGAEAWEALGAHYSEAHGERDGEDGQGR